MQGIIVRAVRSCQETLKAATLQHLHGGEASKAVKIFPLFGRVSSSRSPLVQLKGLENVSVAEVLMTKGGEKTGSWLWCRTDDAVIDAVKNVSLSNISLVWKLALHPLLLDYMIRFTQKIEDDDMITIIYSN
jgi:hypothetical protein